MRITYFALREIRVLDDLRQPGDLVPEAADWPFLSGYIRDCHLAPVLVATLPQAAQNLLAEWEKAQRAQSDQISLEPEIEQPETDVLDSNTTTTRQRREKARQ